MPRGRRKSASSVTSALEQVQRQARSLLGNLNKEIRAKETELHRLKQEESRLGMLIGRRQVGRPRALGGGSGAGGGGGRRGGRINWREVLKQLPKQFKASDVRTVRGLKGKRPSEIFAAITRWINAGSAKRRARGVYEKVA